MSTETSLSPQRVRRRVRKRGGRSYRPPSFTWIKGVMILFLVGGLGCLLSLISWAIVKSQTTSYELDDMAFRMMIYGGFFSLLYTVIPIGVLRKKKWAYHAGLALSSLLLLGFPIGTILGVITIKAFSDAKSAFGVN
jgi:hypothetical protein